MLQGTRELEHSFVNCKWYVTQGQYTIHSNKPVKVTIEDCY